MKSGEKLQKLLTLLVTWGMLLVFFVGYEIYFVRGQEQFLQANGFRSLAALGKELNAKVTKARASTESFVHLVHDRNPDSDAIHAYLRLYLESPTIVSDEKSLRNCATIISLGNQTHVPLAFIPRDNTLVLSVSCFERNSDDTPKLTMIPLYTVDIRSWFADAFQQQTNDFDDVLVADETGRVFFEQSTRGPRIANLKALMPESDDSAPPSERKDQKKAAKDTKPAADKEQNPGADNTDVKDGEQRLSGLQKLAGASSVTKITYAGKSYQMFSQPVRIRLPNTPTGGKALNLGIYGLWDGDRFENASRRIPYSTLIWAALIVVALLSLTWPLFKLRYMGNTERFNAADGWLLVLAVSLASASVTLMLLNASYVAHAQGDVDQTMKDLACRIKQHLEDEIVRANQQLAEFRNHPVKEGLLLSDYLKLSEPQREAAVTFYPYFDGVSWINDKGMQVAKIDVKAAPTPYVAVLTRQYFRSIVSDSKRRKAFDRQLETRQSIKTPQSGTNVSYLEPILSMNTDEFYAVLSSPFKDEGKANGNKIVVVALTTRPLSLVNPVLPPGYRFAVIDRDCNVMFHSDSFRNLRENFCDESKDQDELRPWLFAGVNASFDISYQGHPVRAFLTAIDAPPFVDRQPFLLVFRESDLDLTLNLAVVLVCTVLLATYFSLLVAIAITYLLLKRSLRLIYPPRFIWPQPSKGVRYVQLFGANVVLLLFFWLFYPRLYEAPLVGLTIAIAVVAALLALFTLAVPRWGPIVLGGLLLCGTFAAWSALLYYDRDSLTDWEPVLALLAGSILVAVLFAEAISGRVTTFAASIVSTSIVSNGLKWAETWFRVEASRPIRSWVGRVSTSLSEPGWLTKSAQKHFVLAYVLLVLSIVTATVLVPCIGFFKYAYDTVSELSLKHDELVLSQRVLDRRARIRQYYDDKVTGPSEIAKARFDESWDRYDVLPGNFRGVERPVFAMGDLGFFDSPPLTLPQDQGAKLCAEEARHESHVGINDVLERWMARATLKFPKNSLGQEMSKLGVASTEGGSSSWTEKCSTNFKLVLTTPSGSPYLTVVSTYRDWWGLRWRDRILLLPLWIILSFWLMIVADKIFFANTEDILLDTVDWKGLSDIKKNFLVIERAKSGRAEWMRTIADLPPDSRLDLRVELKKIVDGKSIEINSTSSIVILDYFEFNLRDSKYNLARLELLEKLLLDTSRKLVLVSTIDPLFFLTESGPEVLSESKNSAIANRLLDRWAEVLGRFTRVHPKDSGDKGFHQTLESFDKAHAEGDRHKSCRQFAIWIKQECDCTTRLRQIGKELLDEYREQDCHASREWVVNRVLDLSDSYYHVLWSGLTISERLVLYQLAMDGWANPKNTTSIQQLKRKLLISRKPMYRIMNESFRRFVQGSEHGAEIARWQKREQQSTWRAFRFVAIAAAVGTGLWMLYTQAAFSQAVVGYIAAIATLLTAVASLFGRSGGNAAGPKPE